MDPIQTFKEIYGQVPDWVAAMNRFAPDALLHYTNLRMSIMEDGALCRKEKELLLVGVNAARRYETSMLYHTQGAIDAGATASEIADTVMTGVISRGLPTWLEGQKAVEYALDRERAGARGNGNAGLDGVGQQAAQFGTRETTELHSIEACENYYDKNFGSLPDWARVMREHDEQVLIAYTNLRLQCLKQTELSAKFRELILVAINAAERYELGVDIHTKSAFAKGLTKEELTECLLTVVLTAGIPGWFMGYEYLRD